MPHKTFILRNALWVSLLLLGQPVAGQIVATQGDHLAVDVSRTDGRIAMDLLGIIWLLPPRGGTALKLTDTALPARRPRWSPDGLQILYQTTGIDTSQLWLAEVATGRSIQLGQRVERNHQAAWHPEGERIIFSSWRRDTGLDIWEMDLHTGLEWRLSNRPGDETEPAWSRDGRHLAYIHHKDSTWTLVLRRFGDPEVDLIVSETPLASPSWRPDGTLITFLKKSENGYALQMAILSEPVLERELGGNEDYFLSPVSWLDRNHLYYTADGRIKTLGFGEWRSHRINFRATIGKPDPRPEMTIAEHDLPLVTPPSGKLVIRSTRLFDGLTRGYRDNMDVLIDGGTIEAVLPRQDWPDVTVLDVGNATLLPGFIDVYAAMPDGPPTRSGAELLAYGVTTFVSTGASPHEFEMWEDEKYPGPRVLRAANLAATRPQETEQPIYLAVVTAGTTEDPEQREQVQQWQKSGTPVLAENRVIGRSIGASLFLAADTVVPSPLGNRYQDRQVATIGDPVALLSGLAGEGTPGLATLLGSRQASRYRGQVLTRRRLTSMPHIDVGLSPIVLASKPNGMPPGLALHAELRALSAAGLSGDQVLKATGRNAARILGLGGKIGQITPGARADLVLVSGDPLVNVADTLNIIAVIRNGRFFSLVSLLERARVTGSVE